MPAFVLVVLSYLLFVRCFAFGNLIFRRFVLQVLLQVLDPVTQSYAEQFAKVCVRTVRANSVWRERGGERGERENSPGGRDLLSSTTRGDTVTVFLLQH